MALTRKPKTRPVGRPRNEGEIVEERLQIKFKPSEYRQLQESRGTKKMATYIKELIADRYHGALVHVSEVGLGDKRLKYLTKAPCGPMEEALEHAGEFVLSQSMADYLEADEGDVIVGAMGDSMEGAGIHDGFLVLMRPVSPYRRPRRGEIVLVQIVNEYGEYFGTIKTWDGADPVRLKDGDGNDYPIPENTREVLPIAVARGIVGRL